MLTYWAALLEDHLFDLTKVFLVPDHSFEIKEEKKATLIIAHFLLCPYFIPGSLFEGRKKTSLMEK